MNTCIWFYYILTLFILTEGNGKSLLKILFLCWIQHWVHSRITLGWIFNFFFLRLCFIFLVLHGLVYLGLFPGHYGYKTVEILDSVLFLLIKCCLLSGSYPNCLLKLSTLKTLYLGQQLQFRLFVFIMVSVYFTHSTISQKWEQTGYGNLISGSFPYGLSLFSVVDKVFQL